MTNNELDNELRLSYYKEIGVLNEEHHIYLVQHTLSSKTYVKKIRTLYNPDVYIQLSNNPVSGVPQIHECIEKDGNLIVIEEYISGTDLDTYINEHGFLSEREAVKYTISLCETLSKLHSFNPPIIHRDIKPSNIMLTDDKRIILLDLNSAKNVTSGKKQDTMLLGTHGFAAPEQYGFGVSGIQTDLYAIGILLKYILGFKDEVSCSKKLNTVIEKCTRLEPETRYSSASNLKKALSKCLDEKQKFPITAVISSCLALLAAITIIIFLTKNNNIHNPEIYDKFNVLISDNTNNTPTTITPVLSLEQISVSPTQNDSNTTSIPSPTIIEPFMEDKLNLQSPIGTYEGNDQEKLVIAENGYAYYYCYDIEYTELECPWSLSEGVITISFSIMHCDISAKVREDYSELVFKSDSLNWNAEVFQKISSDTDSYILDSPPSPDSNVTVLNSGEKQFTLNNICFTVPKQFRVMPMQDKYNPATFTSGTNGTYLPIILLLDEDAGYNDPQNYFTAYIYAFQIAGNIETVKNHTKQIAETSMKATLDSVQVTYSEDIKIAGRDSLLICVSGLLNSNFGELSSSIETGYLLFIPSTEDNKIILIQMLQRVGTKNDDETSFRYVMENASTIE